MKLIAKKGIALLLTMLMVVTLLAGCTKANENNTANNTTSASQPQMTLKFAYDDTTTASYYKGLVAFKEEVEKKTNGNIKVEIYADRQLGNAIDTIEGLKLGTIECTFASTAALSGFVPEFAVVDAPFIFRDAKHADAVMDGEIGQWLNKLTLEKQGIRVMGYMDTGFRNVYSTKPVRTVEDFKGLKIRTMESELHVNTFKAFGAIPSPMPSSEVFTGLSQGTIDAAENCFSYVVNQKLYEVAKYMTESGHFYGFCAIMIAEPVFQKMSSEQQKIVLTAATNCIALQREIAEKDNVNAKKKLAEELGVEVIEIDRDALRKAVQSVYDNNKTVLDSEIIAKIEAVGK